MLFVYNPDETILRIGHYSWNNREAVLVFSEGKNPISRTIKFNEDIFYSLLNSKRDQIYFIGQNHFYILVINDNFTNDENGLLPSASMDPIKIKHSLEKYELMTHQPFIYKNSLLFSSLVPDMHKIIQYFFDENNIISVNVEYFNNFFYKNYPKLSPFGNIYDIVRSGESEYPILKIENEYYLYHDQKLSLIDGIPTLSPNKNYFSIRKNGYSLVYKCIEDVNPIILEGTFPFNVNFFTDTILRRGEYFWHLNKRIFLKDNSYQKYTSLDTYIGYVLVNDFEKIKKTIMPLNQFFDLELFEIKLSKNVIDFIALKDISDGASYFNSTPSGLQNIRTCVLKPFDTTILPSQGVTALTNILVDEIFYYFLDNDNPDETRMADIQNMISTENENENLVKILFLPPILNELFTDTDNEIQLLIENHIDVFRKILDRLSLEEDSKLFEVITPFLDEDVDFNLKPTEILEKYRYNFGNVIAVLQIMREIKKLASSYEKIINLVIYISPKKTEILEYILRNINDFINCGTDPSKCEKFTDMFEFFFKI